MSDTHRVVQLQGRPTTTRDYKPWWKPDSWYKHMLQRLRRARARQAVREGREPERERREDGYEWT